MSENPAQIGPRQRLAWLLRREIWEHPSILVAPMVAAGIGAFGFFVSLFRLPDAVASLAGGPAMKGAVGTVQWPFAFVALAVLMLGVFVSFFYALSCLHGERKDRSIQFWKSLPVSDGLTVTSKAAILLAIIPAITFATVLAAQAAMLVVGTIVVLMNGLDPGPLWRNSGLELMWVVFPYGLIINALWLAPVYGWFMLVSAWARRATFLWALAPIMGLGFFQLLATGHPTIMGYFGWRLSGGIAHAFSKGGRGQNPVDGLGDLDPLRVLADPNLVGGLIFFAVCLVVATRLRRHNDPI